MDSSVEKCDHSSCSVCYLEKPTSNFFCFESCGHAFCIDCVTKVFEMKVTDSQVKLECLQCSGVVLQHEVREILDDDFYEKYLQFALRQYLSTNPNVRFCLAPDCPYACIFENVSGCDESHFACARVECSKEYCYKCKLPWHHLKTCEQARSEVAINMPEDVLTDDVVKKMKLKSCPSCHATIEKMSDGSCNQVHCASCNVSFCWLCGKEVSEMHYLSPTGCPLYGRARWGKRKRWFCRAGMWITGPFFVMLVAFLAFPILIIVLPIFVGYKVHKSKVCSSSKKHCKTVIVIVAVLISLCGAPFIASLIALFLIPLGFLYIYCIVPVHLCCQSA